ncbi:fatty-acid amide hydrolase 2-A [Latimeria chalumnae]|uniref:Fatty acid amide hydrolase 2 n=1 Tax=Latimeria chalumnae TaxID=7897 RepID=H3B5C6_LATCH|nr:PREDICTED: fatty-acid amide hydrolase 2 [Latimeria chalumnae]|eukprot:XP_005994805.1 PREDICTED: fatty-acid amide hydrolase 2 [Latimeria chalumnae]
MPLSLLERCMLFILRSLSYILYLVLYVIERLNPPVTPSVCRGLQPVEDPLLLLPGVQLARMIRQRKVKCEQVVKVYIKRIQEVNPIINAVVKDRFEEALLEARQVDAFVSEEHEDEKLLEEKFPFLGVPLTVKEAFALQGMPNSSGLVNRKHLISETDATVVLRLKQAGAIPLGVTNCSEVCMWYESSNKVYGRTRNPYNAERIVGGSSGGEGSIIAAAGSVMGVGSDIGGSIRMPAFFNGIFGHKATTGVVPNEGQFPIATGPQKALLSTGPMCRYAEDLIPMLKIMAGPDVNKLKLDQEVSVKNIKFYSMEHDGGSIFVSSVDQELIEAQRRVVEHLQTDLGVEVQHVKISLMKYSFQIWSAAMSSKGPNGKEAQTFTELLGDHGKPVWPFWELVKWILGLSSHTFPAIGLASVEKFSKVNVRTNAKALKLGEKLREELTSLLATDGVLLYPSHPKIAPKHYHPLLMPFNFSYTGIFNVLGLPVTQCPLGLSNDLLPLGIQVVANHYNDHLTLAVARYLEQTFGAWTNSWKH